MEPWGGLSDQIFLPFPEARLSKPWTLLLIKQLLTSLLASHISGHPPVTGKPVP